MSELLYLRGVGDIQRTCTSLTLNIQHFVRFKPLFALGSEMKSSFRSYQCSSDIAAASVFLFLVFLDLKVRSKLSSHSPKFDSLPVLQSLFSVLLFVVVAK